MAKKIKIPFSPSVFAHTSKTRLNKEILQAVESSPELRKEISRVFQQANRRIQNIEKAGLISPAVAALHRDTGKYTKFSMNQDWESLKIEYGKAISFLRQPTSTASGTRQYNEHLRTTYDLSKEEFDLMARNLQGKLNSVSDTEFVERYLMRYKDFTGELEQSARDISTQIESEAVSIQRAIDDNIQREANKISGQLDEVDKEIDRIMKGFSKFGL
jgi:hypothetical protein